MRRQTWKLTKENIHAAFSDQLAGAAGGRYHEVSRRLVMVLAFFVRQAMDGVDQLYSCSNEEQNASACADGSDLQLLMAFVLVHAVHYAGAVGAGQGAAVGFFNWLGFGATIMLTITLYEKRPTNLFCMNSGFQMISC